MCYLNTAYSHVNEISDHHVLGNRKEQLEMPSFVQVVLRGGCGLGKLSPTSCISKNVLAMLWFGYKACIPSKSHVFRGGVVEK